MLTHVRSVVHMIVFVFFVILLRFMKLNPILFLFVETYIAINKIYC